MSKRTMNSIAMAVYNGGKHIRKQLDSILVQLDEEDELVISDDGSSDDTIAIVNEYKNKYKNVFLYKNNGAHGIAGNFSNAIEKCRGDYIFICDQDDYWYPEKIKTIDRYFDQNEDIMVIMHDERMVTDSGEILKTTFSDRMKHGCFQNIIKSSYYGHRMAFRKEFTKEFLPIPFKCKLYDQYIGLCAERNKKVLFVNDILTDYCIHENNFSQSSLSALKRIQYRINLILSYLNGRLKNIES